MKIVPSGIPTPLSLSPVVTIPAALLGLAKVTKLLPALQDIILSFRTVSYSILLYVSSSDGKTIGVDLSDPWSLRL